jgi:hypothetical protein
MCTESSTGLGESSCDHEFGLDLILDGLERMAYP